jgi:hypothetical protein
MFDEFPSRSSEAEADSFVFGGSIGVADSTGPREASGVALGVDTGSKVGLGSGLTI